MKQPEELPQPEEWGEPEDFAELERYLAQALHRVDAPAGFADRVMARALTAAPEKAKIFVMARRPRFWVSGAIAAALLAGAYLGDQAYLRHQRAQAELAQQQFEAAIRITDQALAHTREQLREAGLQIGN